VTILGCGLNQTVPATAINPTTGAFTFVIPLTQATGDCTLTFTANDIDPTTTTTLVTFDVAPATGSGETGLGTPPLMAAPTLQSAGILTNGFDGSAQSVVQFVFSGPVTPNGVLADFSLVGFDTMRDTSNDPTTTAISAVRDGTNPNAIDVGYPAAVDPASYTVAAADNTGTTNATPDGSAVVGTTGADAGLNNPLGSVPLGGSRGPTSVTTGDTTAPDLVGCAVNPANTNQIIYTFDKPVATVPAGNVATDFGYYTTAGTPFTVGGTLDGSFVPGSTQVPIDFNVTRPTIVRAAFEPVTQFAPSTEVRCAVLQGAVQGNATGTEGENPVAAAGAPTSAPDLTSITPVAGNSTQYDFHFDETVASTNTPADFLLYVNNATQFVGQTVVNVINTDTVRIEFAPFLTQANVGNVVLGAVVPGAVTSPSSLFGNTIGSEPISGIITNGQITDGPQLQTATGSSSDLSVTYNFNPQGSSLATPNPAGFFVIDNAGNPTFGTAATLQGNSVIVTFTAAALAFAMGAGVTSPNNGTETITGSGGDGGGDGVPKLALTTVAVYNAAGNQNAPGDVTLSVGP